eukprot:c52679_g1_i1.p1 GENE.c52679_g1_i1~~c52679_g1_i1.p1  ORF type:complete len:239 (-),score=48.44 c52679_g1_i1:296-982(-)
MVLRVFAHPVSQPARAVLWALYNQNTPFELVLVNPGSTKEGGTRHPSFLAINPHGTVPTIDDDGFVLSESHAILLYLAQKHNWTLVPTNPKELALLNQYLHWHHRSVRECTIGFMRPVLLNVKVTPAELKTPQTLATKALDQLEIDLGRTPFILGQSPTIADLSAYCEIGQLGPKCFNVLDFSSRPNLAAWLQRCEQLAGFEQSHSAVFKLAPRIAPALQKLHNTAKL